MENIKVRSIVRDERIDSIRGLLIIFMAMDHYGGLISHYLWQPLGYFSNAEGFVFISGFVFSMVYMQYLNDIVLFTRKIIKRFSLIYTYHITLILGFLIISYAIPLYAKAWENMLCGFYSSHLLKNLIASLFLIYQPTFLDVLPIYSIFILLSFPAMLLVKKGRYDILLYASASIWLIGQFVNPVAIIVSHYFPECFPGIFNIFAWQFMFFLGVYYGSRHGRNEEDILLQSRPIFWGLVLVAFLCFLARHHIIELYIIDNHIYDNRQNLTWLRIVNFIAVTAIITRILRNIPRSCGIPWVKFIGKHSLQTFSFHVLVLYLIIRPLCWGAGTDSLFWGHQIDTRYGRLLYFIVCFLYLALLTIPAQIHDFYLKWRKYRRTG